jgi:hypothetical protein
MHCLHPQPSAKRRPVHLASCTRGVQCAHAAARLCRAVTPRPPYALHAPGHTSITGGRQMVLLMTRPALCQASKVQTGSQRCDKEDGVPAKALAAETTPPLRRHMLSSMCLAWLHTLSGPLCLVSPSDTTYDDHCFAPATLTSFIPEYTPWPAVIPASAPAVTHTCPTIRKGVPDRRLPTLTSPTRAAAMPLPSWAAAAAAAARQAAELDGGQLLLAAGHAQQGQGHQTPHTQQLWLAGEGPAVLSGDARHAALPAGDTRGTAE